MIRKYQMRLVADDNPGADVDAGGGELVDFGQQRLRIDDNAVADDARHARMENPRRNEAQHELLSIDVHRVSRVVPALITRDDGKPRCDEVDDLSFAFIAPLRAENREVHSRVRFYFEPRRHKWMPRNCAIARSTHESRKTFFIPGQF